MTASLMELGSVEFGRIAGDFSKRGSARQVLTWIAEVESALERGQS